MCAALFGLILRPVISADLVGEQVGLTRKRSNAVPVTRSLSMFGVFPKAAPAKNKRNNANFITWTALVIHRARDMSFFLFDRSGVSSNITSC